MKICVVENCNNQVAYPTMGLCRSHYAMQRKSKTTEICSTYGCDRVIHNIKRKLCKRCYFYWLQTDAPHKPRCSIDGCERPAWSKGFCSSHYKQGYRIGGHPSLAPGRGSPGKSRGIRSLKGEYIKNGYKVIRVIRINGTKLEWIHEHRYVMEQKIGRFLLTDENVHHIDGNKINNDPNNLELWLIRQPQGQRVEDLVKWAKEIINRYG